MIRENNMPSTQHQMKRFSIDVTCGSKEDVEFLSTYFTIVNNLSRLEISFIPLTNRMNTFLKVKTSLNDNRYGEFSIENLQKLLKQLSHNNISDLIIYDISQTFCFQIKFCGSFNYTLLYSGSENFLAQTIEVLMDFNLSGKRIAEIEFNLELGHDFQFFKFEEDPQSKFLEENYFNAMAYFNNVLATIYPAVDHVFIYEDPKNIDKEKFLAEIPDGVDFYITHRTDKNTKKNAYEIFYYSGNQLLYNFFGLVHKTDSKAILEKYLRKSQRTGLFVSVIVPSIDLLLTFDPDGYYTFDLSQQIN